MGKVSAEIQIRESVTDVKNDWDGRVFNLVLFLLPSTGGRQRRRRGRFHRLGRHAALWWQLTGAGRGRVHVRRGGPGAGAAQGEEPGSV